MNRRLFIGAMGMASCAMGMGRRAPGKPKYIFLMIGDGMGEAQRIVADCYIRSKYPTRNAGLMMDRLPVAGMTTTHTVDGKITDSAAAGTALSCGKKTVNGAVCMAEDLKTPLRPLAFDARDAGMRVGLVTSVPVDHATPACFYAQVPKRNMYYEIDEQLMKSGLDYFAGEPLLGRGKANDRPSPEQMAEENGYRMVSERAAFDALQPGDRKVVVEHKMGYAIDGDQSLTLADLTRKGIELLDNENGFFMMVEGGKIDWSGHANDLPTNIHETLAFDESVAAVIEFYKKHPDETLVIVTADHETGGLQVDKKTAGFSEVIDAQKLRGQIYISKVEGWKKRGVVTTDKAYDQLVKGFGLSDLSPDAGKHIRAAIAQTFSSAKKETQAPEIQKMYGKRNAAVTSCQHALAVRAGTQWTSFKHTLVPVPTTAAGRWAKLFGGEYDNTDIGLRLKELICS